MKIILSIDSNRALLIDNVQEASQVHSNHMVLLLFKKKVDRDVAKNLVNKSDYPIIGTRGTSIEYHKLYVSAFAGSSHTITMYKEDELQTSNSK